MIVAYQNLSRWRLPPQWNRNYPQWDEGSQGVTLRCPCTAHCPSWRCWRLIQTEIALCVAHESTPASWEKEKYIQSFLVPLFLANLQTTWAFWASCKSSQTGSPPTRMFPSWGPDPPTSLTSEVSKIKVNRIKSRSSGSMSHELFRLTVLLFCHDN